MKVRARELIEIGDKLFSTRQSLVTHWQEVAENFYPERADFTTSRHLGTDFAGHLMTGGPVLARRDLANQFAAMLRPRGKPWFSLTPQEEELSEIQAVAEFVEHMSDTMRRAMYDPAAKFTRATKEGDNDFAAFGQAVMSVEIDQNDMTLLYRCWHLRDVVWAENDKCDIDAIHRNWKMRGSDLIRRYKDKVPAKVQEAAKKDPYKEFECRHIIVPYDSYDYTPKGNRKPKEGQFKYMSILAMKEEDAVLAEVPVADHQYILPRWQTVSGSQYAHSPATVVAIPDARVLQRITYTLLEAGEKATNPAMLAVQEAIRSDVALYAGGITWVDAEYDERLGEVLRPMQMDKSGLSFGADLADRHEAAIKKAFFLDQLNLPAFDGKAMTATEVRTRTEEYIRAALPLFEPLEAEYNGALCEKTFNLMMRQGAFGNPRDWPEEIQGQALKWQFESPLSDAGRKEDAFKFKEAAELLAIAGQIDPQLIHEYDAREAFRDALYAIKAPVVDEEKSDEARQQAAQQAQMQSAMGQVGQGAGVAEQVGKAMGSLGLNPNGAAA